MKVAAGKAVLAAAAAALAPGRGPWSVLPKVCIYSNRALGPSSFSREHVLPKSLLKRCAPGAKSDLHNLFACDMGVNRMRSNYDFASWTLRRGEDPWLWHFDDRARLFMPPAHAMGTVGRAVLYMKDAYPEASLPGDHAMFTRWLDVPLTHTEYVHHEIVKRLQGNRNEYVEERLALLGREGCIV